MAQTVEQALATARLYSDERLYKMVHLPAGAVLAAAGVLAEIGEPFSALIVDKDEVTLVITADDLQEYTRRLPGHVASYDDYRLITFDIELEPTLVGFMARISAALAQAQLTILPIAAFNRDHLLVPSGQFDQAMVVLRNLQSAR
jgi:hypothetical protein